MVNFCFSSGTVYPVVKVYRANIKMVDRSGVEPESGDCTSAFTPIETFSLPIKKATPKDGLLLKSKKKRRHALLSFGRLARASGQVALAYKCFP